MTTRRFEVAELVEILRSRVPRPGTGFDEQRALGELAAARVPIPPGVTSTAFELGSVAAERLTPPGAVLGRTIVHLHGGAYVMGSLATVRGLAAQLALATRAEVVTLDYRLAPEAPHPAATCDVVAAYRALMQDGRDPRSIVLSGDSAGGGLAIAALVSLRDAGLSLPAAGVCLSPWSDLTLNGPSIDANAERDPQVQRWMLDKAADLYANGANRRSPALSPAHADLRGLPPLLIHTGEAEALVDDARALARNATRAGVDVTLECWPGMIHVWHAFAPGLAEGTAALERLGDWLEARWPE